jgi:hypothetical protein
MLPLILGEMAAPAIEQIAGAATKSLLSGSAGPTAAGPSGPASDDGPKNPLSAATGLLGQIGSKIGQLL